MLLYFPNSAFSEEFVEPFIHPSAAERDIDHRKAAAHVGYLFEAGAELGARNADMLRLVRRPDQFETAADLAEGNDLPADMAAQRGPRLLQTLQLEHPEQELLVLGPFPAIVAKVRDLYRMNILVKCPQMELVKRALWNSEFKECRNVFFDVDPVSVV